jgi:hypothetical protein
METHTANQYKNLVVIGESALRKDQLRRMSRIM